MLKQPMIRSEKHRRFVASLPCCMSGIEGRTQCAHIRSNTGGGMGLKPSDVWCVPLSVEEHHIQHSVGESDYWGERLDLAKALAQELYANTGDYDKCRKLIDQFRWKGIGL